MGALECTAGSTGAIDSQGTLRAMYKIVWFHLSFPLQT